MTNIHLLLSYVLPLALVGTAFVLARRRTEGASRHCLLGFLGIVFGTTLVSFTIQVLSREGILAAGSYLNVVSLSSALLVVLNLASLALLVAYVALQGTVQRGPSGFGGWLKFYGVVQLYVAPIAAVATGIYLGPTLVRVSGEYPGMATFLAAQYVALLAVTGVGAYAAWRLQRLEPSGLRLTRVYLWLLLAVPLAGLVLAPLIEVPRPVRIDFGELQRLDLLKALVFFLVWWNYFKISRRVRNTFTPHPGA